MPLISNVHGSPSKEDIRNIIKEEIDSANKNNKNSNKSNQVFVSHSFQGNDPDLAKTLEKELAKYNISAYLAEKEKRYGYIISNKIREAIRDSFCMVVILTNNSIISASVNQELGYAMGIERDIIPMVRTDIKDKVGVLLNDIEGEEFDSSNFEEKCRIIAEHISTLPKNKNTPSEHEQKFQVERGNF